MLSARSQVSVRPLYGVEEFRKSRSMAGGMTGGLVLLALAVCLMTPSVKILTPPKAPSSIMLMRVIRPEPTPEAKPVQPDAMRKLLSPESEVTIPVPPPVVERPTPPPAAPKPVAPEPVKPKPDKKAPPVKKTRPVVRQPEKPVPPSAPVGQQTEIPPVSAGTGVSSVAAAPPAPVGGTQERPDDKSKALGAILDALNRHKRYPKQARRIGAEGTVQLLVTISADGKVSACSLGKGSGFGVRDPANGSARSLSALIYPRSVGEKVFRFWCRCATRSRMRDVPPVVLAGQERPMRGPLLTYGPPFPQSPYSETLG